MKLRGDDPVGMKNFIISIQNRVKELKTLSRDAQSSLDSKRMEFELETICDIKNNKKRPKEETMQQLTRIKKWLQKYCLCDHFKEVESMELMRSMHLSKFVAEMLASYTLSLSVLKVVDLGDVTQLTHKGLCISGCFSKPSLSSQINLYGTFLLELLCQSTSPCVTGIRDCHLYTRICCKWTQLSSR